ncbi:M48 family metalloprotease [Neopusillimonas maritima]|nr:M48 family metalloprotease [Neopusillimonas maritima]
MKLKRWLCTFFLVCVAGAQGLQAQPVGLPSMGAASSADLSPALEQTLGDAIMEQGRRFPSYINDADVSQYLLGLGRRLSRASSGADVTVFGVRDPSINAFALPGGYVGINSGLIVAADNESQLASVVAHEIAHVYQRHVARGMTQSTKSRNIALASIAGALLAALAGSGDLAMGVAAFGQAAAVDQQLGFSRQAEQEADRAGFEMLAKAGFDPAGMVQMFSKLENAARLNRGAGGGAYASTHPLSIQRMSDIENRARGMSAGRHQDSDAFWFVRSKLRVLQARDSGSARNAESVLRQEASQHEGVRRAAAWYGLAYLAWERKAYDEVAQALRQAGAQGVQSPPMASLEIDLAMARNQVEQARQIADRALARWPENQGVGLAAVEALLKNNETSAALNQLDNLIERWPEEPRFYQLQAQAFERLGEPVKARRAMADYYEKMGALAAAVEQLQQARGLSKDFYEQSELDVRIRELQERVRTNRELLEQFR